MYLLGYDVEVLNNFKKIICKFYIIKVLDEDPPLLKNFRPTQTYTSMAKNWATYDQLGFDLIFKSTKGTERKFIFQGFWSEELQCGERGWGN